MATRTRPALVDGSARSTVAVALMCVVLAAVVGLMTVRLGSVQHQLKALLLVVAVIVIVVGALRPRLGLVTLLALMPFEFGFYGTGSNEVLIVTLAAVLVWRVRASAIPAWMTVGGLALVLGSFIAAVGAQDRTTAAWGGVRWLGAVILLFAAVSLLRGRRDASRRMVDVFTASAVIVVVFAFVQKAGIYVLVGHTYNPGHPSSFFGYYTNYAGYVAIAGVLATGELLLATSQRHTSRAALYGAALVFILVGIAISLSRGGLIALGGGWLALLLLNVRRGSVLVRTLMVLASVAAISYVAIPRATIVTLQQRFSVKASINFEDKARFALQKTGEQALGQRPAGLGYGNFPYYLQSHAHSPYIQFAFYHAHETPVQIGLDAGWLGLAGFLILFGWPIGLVLTRTKGGPSSLRASAFAAALCGFMAQGLFDYLFDEIDFLVFFVALVWGTAHALDVDAPGVGDRLATVHQWARRPRRGVAARVPSRLAAGGR